MKSDAHVECRQDNAGEQSYVEALCGEGVDMQSVAKEVEVKSMFRVPRTLPSEVADLAFVLSSANLHLLQLFSPSNCNCPVD